MADQPEPAAWAWAMRVGGRRRSPQPSTLSPTPTAGKAQTPLWTSRNGATMAAVKRGRFGALLAAAAVVAGCSSSTPGASPAITSPTTSSPVTTAAIAGIVHIEVSDGCPSVVHTVTGDEIDGWIYNPDSAGLSTSLVPGVVTGGLICRYSSLDQSGRGGTLFSHSVLDSAAASALAHLADEIPFTPNVGHAGCALRFSELRVTIVVFSRSGLPGVDVWFDDHGSNCDSLSNGYRGADAPDPALTEIVAEIDRLVAPAPPVCLLGPSAPCRS
jgi:hypothetical protein